MSRWIAQATLTGVASLGITLLWLGSPQARADEPALPRQTEARFQKADANGDGKVERAESELDDATFNMLDHDGDGSVTRGEVRRYLKTDRARKRAQQTKQVKERFAKADQNGDGVVTRDEFPAAEELFERFDRDGDGQVVLSEAMAYAAEEEVTKLFGAYDTDLSGTLSRDEVPDRGDDDNFELVDVDADGQITGEEALAFFLEISQVDLGASDSQAPQPGLPATPSDPGQEMAGKLGVLGVLMQGFAKLDEDNDGSLTRREFSGSRELFGRLDVDRSGGVTPPEIELRVRHAKRLGARGKELKAMAQRLGAETWLAVVGTEVKALFESGRYEEVQALMDELELRMLQRSSEK